MAVVQEMRQLNLLDKTMLLPDEDTIRESTPFGYRSDPCRNIWSSELCCALSDHASSD